MQLFSADATIFLKKTWKNHPQKLPIIGPIFMGGIAHRPKTSPNLNFCSIKIFHCVTYV